MHHFIRSAESWWRKPLVQLGSRHIPAELAVLELELRPGEEGAWLNSRGVITGTADLIRDAAGNFKTRRISLPEFVSARLKSLYLASNLSNGAPDLVIWNVTNGSLRLVEVKCPHWDKPSANQLEFLKVAAGTEVEVSIVEWEFPKE
jgi:hypothetical protein